MVVKSSENVEAVAVLGVGGGEPFLAMEACDGSVDERPTEVIGPVLLETLPE